MEQPLVTVGATYHDFFVLHKYTQDTCVCVWCVCVIIPIITFDVKLNGDQICVIPTQLYVEGYMGNHSV